MAVKVDGQNKHDAMRVTMETPSEFIRKLVIDSTGTRDFVVDGA